MSIPPYVEGYPPDVSSLGQTKAVIRDNLDGTFLTLSVDHVNNNGQSGSNPAGYHTLIHQVTQTAVNTISNVNQLFSGVPGALVVNSTITSAIPPNGDTQLYSLTGNGGLSQLTGNKASANGYVWIGGILMQWGIVSVTSGSWPTTSQSVTFSTSNVNFPKNCFVVIPNFIGPTSSSTGELTINSISQTGFTWQFSGSSSATFGGFYWMAIGN